MKINAKWFVLYLVWLTATCIGANKIGKWFGEKIFTLDEE